MKKALPTLFWLLPKFTNTHRFPAGLVVQLVSIYRTMFRHRTSAAIGEKRIQERKRYA